MHADLQLLSHNVKQLYKYSDPVRYAWTESCDIVGLEALSHCRNFGLLFCDHPDLQFSPNAYHNHYHSAEVVLSASVLLKNEFPNIQENKKLSFTFLFAMLCHDLAHNGKSNTFPYELEKKACISIIDYFYSNHQVSGYWKKHLYEKYGEFFDFCKTINDIILGTDFTQDLSGNLDKYNDSLKDEEKLLLLGTEADTLMSCMPEFGNERGAKLAIERSNGKIAKPSSRLYFLSQVKYLSKSSKELGIPQLIKAQIKEIEEFYI